MHLDVFLIEQLANELNTLLKSQKLKACYSVSIADIYFEFETTVIRCQFYKGELFLQFPASDKVQKKNRLTALDSLVGQTLIEVRSIQLERSMHFQFEHATLAFYFYGRFASLGVYADNQLVDQFPAKSKCPEQLTISDMAFKPVANYEELKKAFGFVPFEDGNAFNYPLSETEWTTYIKQKREVLPIAINKEKKGYVFGKPNENTLSSYETMWEAENDFASLFIASDIFFTAQNKLLAQLKKEQSRLTKKRVKLETQLAQPEQQQFRLKADLLMANLHRIDENKSEVVLENFEDGSPIKIKLNAKITPQANAERYYLKAKNEYKNKENLAQNLSNVKTNLATIETQIMEIESVESYREIKKYIKQKTSESKVERLPYKVFMVDGYEVRVGKSAKDNDELIRHHCSPNDLWLHAKGVSGSHVIVRHQQKLPNPVLEKIASIAAFYSKAKNEQLAAVIYTQKKYIRKFKGGPPGAVKVDKEEVILVEPKLP